ncbi:lactate utilization protein [Proteiniclasticum ruminis]|uniref:lactate utilization protein n=1 Tax=Proteiniclasticum ruminis TaxID=398199 RepID=UPI0028A007F2|nr:lactate utilization protein [Proteiniclasticum ruminis]
MDQHLNAVWQMKIERLIKNLEKNQMKGTFLKDREALQEYMNQQIPDEVKVAVGGSQTLFEIGVIEYLRTRNVTFFDRYEEGLSVEGRKEVFRNSFFADFYFTSTNAITVEGHLYNIDHVGNRVAAMLFGPDKVFVIIGLNKIVDSEEEAMGRIRSIAAPANNVRLNRDTPCTKLGSCTECNAKDRICSQYTMIKRQSVKDRIEVLILPTELGY